MNLNLPWQQRENDHSDLSGAVTCGLGKESEVWSRKSL